MVLTLGDSGFRTYVGKDVCLPVWWPHDRSGWWGLGTAWGCCHTSPWCPSGSGSGHPAPHPQSCLSCPASRTDSACCTCRWRWSTAWCQTTCSPSGWEWSLLDQSQEPNWSPLKWNVCWCLLILSRLDMQASPRLWGLSALVIYISRLWLTAFGILLYLWLNA